MELLFLARHLEVPIVEEAVNWTEIPGDTPLPLIHDDIYVK